MLDFSLITPYIDQIVSISQNNAILLPELSMNNIEKSPLSIKRSFKYTHRDIRLDLQIFVLEEGDLITDRIHVENGRPYICRKVKHSLHIPQREISAAATTKRNEAIQQIRDR